MATVKINQKTYQVPELTFEHSLIMEQVGLPLTEITSLKRIMTAVSAFTMIVAKCDHDYAAHLVQQHVMGGGDILDIYKAYANAIKDSGFFKQMLLEMEQEEEDPVKKSSAKTGQKS